MRFTWLIAVFALAFVLMIPATSRGGRALAYPLLETQVTLGTTGCPERTLLDRSVCVHVGDDDGFSTGEVAPNAHHDRSGTNVEYDQIARLPDRPSDYDLYRYPIPPGIGGGHSVISGYDLDQPDERQRRGFRLHAVGHGGVDLPQAKGTPIHGISLDHQEGDARVVFVGNFFGNTVITLHTIREASGLRDYLLLFGHLDAFAIGLKTGMIVRDGDIIGTVGDTGSKELIHLHLEARRMREGRDATQIHDGEALLDASIVTDPRNVLPLR